MFTKLAFNNNNEKKDSEAGQIRVNMGKLFLTSGVFQRNTNWQKNRWSREYDIENTVTQSQMWVTKLRSSNEVITGALRPSRPKRSS
ncbi:hypothetical protein BgiMline_032452 [Biomphalaria glabrata]|nr:hypothetical protein BgiMline_015464 [Biomphalaria glabrata]